jgi:hypothetical protein
MSIIKEIKEGENNMRQTGEEVIAFGEYGYEG